MITFRAVMTDETGCEFGATVVASDHESAYDKLREDYPESSVAQLESPEDTREREARIYAEVLAEYEDDPLDDSTCYDCGSDLDDDWMCPDCDRD